MFDGFEGFALCGIFHDAAPPECDVTTQGKHIWRSAKTNGILIKGLELSGFRLGKSKKTTLSRSGRLLLLAYASARGPDNDSFISSLLDKLSTILPSVIGRKLSMTSLSVVWLGWANDLKSSV